MQDRIWTAKQQEPWAVQQLSSALGVLPLTARLLINRGLDTPERAERFLRKDISGLEDPFAMQGMEQAVERLSDALKADERVVVFGDYDVDGITSTAILCAHLAEKGLQVDYYIPNRSEEGYGISHVAIDSIAASGCTLIVTVDSGITAVEEVEYAKSLGIDVIITDHHECHERLPDAVAVLNPKRADSTYPFKDLAGVGVVFKLICAMEGADNLSSCIERYVDLVALGTVADVMPLLGENRLLVAEGLTRMERSSKPGLAALMACSGVESKRITTATIGYSLAPRVNAAGRMGCAQKAVELFLTQDEAIANEIAQSLDAANVERREEEDRIMQQALSCVTDDCALLENSILVLDAKSWHSGIIGIVASRLSDLYNKPVILVSFDEEGVGKGSCRSIAGFNIYEALEHCSGSLEQFGGHALAAGLTLRYEQMGVFREAVTAYANRTVEEASLIPKFEADYELPEEDLTLESAADIARLEPYGMGNPTPLFILKSLTVVDIFPLSNGKHLRLTLQKKDRTFHALLFGKNADRFSFTFGESIDMVCHMDVNHFRGVSSVQVVVKDFRESDEQRTAREKDASLYYAYKSGQLPADSAASLIPPKSMFVSVYRHFQTNQSDTFLGVCRKLALLQFSQHTLSKLRICLDVLEEMGIVNQTVESDYVTVHVHEVTGKTDLNQSAILQDLRRLSGRVKAGE